MIPFRKISHPYLPTAGLMATEKLRTKVQNRQNRQIASPENMGSLGWVVSPFIRTTFRFMNNQPRTRLRKDRLTGLFIIYNQHLLTPRV
jgi:hypothetical protein